MLFAVTEIVLDVIALIFQGVESFIFNFPPASARFDQLDDVFSIHSDIGYPGIAVSHLVAALMMNGNLGWALRNFAKILGTVNRHQVSVSHMLTENCCVEPHSYRQMRYWIPNEI